LHISGALGSNTTTYDSAAALKLSNTTDGSSWLLTAGIIGVLNGSFSIRPGAASLPSLVISNVGNVGIGLNSPKTKLHVVGGDSSTSFTTAAISLGFTSTGDYPHFIHTRHAGVAAGNCLDFYTCDGSINGTYPANAVHGMTIENGKVGIGTTAPSSKLHVAGNSSPAIAIENTIATGYSELLFKNTVATGSSIFLNGSAQTGFGGANSLNLYTSNGPLAFHTASVTNVLSISQGGVISVGIASATEAFLINQWGKLSVPAPGQFLLRDHASDPASFPAKVLFSGTTDSFPAIARDGAGIKFTGAAAGLTSWIKVPAVAVTSLPAAATAGVGARAFVNDALAPVFGSAVANGGSAKVPVYSDGSAWYVG
jgi:hypothetical protein